MNKIDYLYDVYCNNNIVVAENVLKSAYMAKERDGGGQVLIDNLQEYVETHSKKLSSFFESNKNGSLTEEDVGVIADGFEQLAHAVNDLLYQKLRTEYTDRQIEKFFEGITTQQLFKTDVSVIREAYNKDCENVQYDVSESLLNNVLGIISFVKEKRSFQKVFGENNWQEMPIQDIIYTLYDYHNKNDAVFKPENVDVFDKLDADDYIIGFFTNIKENCVKVCSKDFERYRPAFISKKNLTPELKKLVFCKNLLEYYRTGVMVFRNNFIENGVDEYYGEKELKHDFALTYGKKFDYDAFKDKQANYIFDPNSVGLEPNKLVAEKFIQKDDSLTMGFLLSSDKKEYYLLHIYLKDLTNERGTYEIQLNALPSSKISNRVQLIRFDNWETKQSHKNVAKKLETSTHIHLYNHFDLLRGKTNGNFDIAYNIEEENTDFVSAINTFFDIIEIDPVLENKIYKKIQKIIKDCESKTTHTEL